MISQLQMTFAQNVARLILHAAELGYGVTLGEAYRPPETAELYAQQGRGSKNSLHSRRLAIDLNLFKDGVYLSSTESHRELGTWWKSLGPNHAWGGDFGDGNHYSLSPDGGKTR